MRIDETNRDSRLKNYPARLYTMLTIICAAGTRHGRGPTGCARRGEASHFDFGRGVRAARALGDELLSHGHWISEKSLT